MRNIYKVAFVAALAALAGCATIMTGSTQKLTFNSNPNGAQVFINGQPVGTTPITIEWKRGSAAATIEFRKEGFETHVANFNTKVNGWFFGNIITGGLIGTTTDAASGALYEYAPDTYQAILAPKTAANLEQFRRDVELQKFVMASYPQIAHDLDRGAGEYLDALIAKLGATDRDQAVATLRDLRANSAGAPDFAARVVASFTQG